jgi:hypothetical protein
MQPGNGKKEGIGAGFGDGPASLIRVGMSARGHFSSPAASKKLLAPYDERAKAFSVLWCSSEAPRHNSFEDRTSKKWSSFRLLASPVRSPSLNHFTRWADVP